MSSLIQSHSSSSSGLYIPIHRRTPSSSSSSTPSCSPSSSSRALSPSPSLRAPVPGVYTPAELLALSHSPLVAQLATSHGVVDALRAVAPEVVQTKKQRKAAAWRARHPVPTGGHRRTSSRGSQSHSESEEERAVSWRRA